jgi:hypothetical protein
VWLVEPTRVMPSVLPRSACGSRMAGWLSTRKFRRLVTPNSMSMSAPPRVAWMVAARSIGLRCTSPATIAWMMRAVTEMWTSSTSRPCSRNSPASWASHRPPCCPAPADQFTVIRSGTGGMVGAGAAPAALAAGGVAPGEAASLAGGPGLGAAGGAQANASSPSRTT